jgi:hypothetical protein
MGVPGKATLAFDEAHTYNPAHRKATLAALIFSKRRWFCRAHRMSMKLMVGDTWVGRRQARVEVVANFLNKYQGAFE